MATKGYQAQAPAMPAAGERAGSRVISGNGAPKGNMPLPRRGQVKEKIIKDMVAVVTTVINMAAGLVRADKNGAGAGAGAGGLPAAGDADAK